MSYMTDDCLSCRQTYYQQSLLPLEYVDFTFGGQQISLIGCFVESANRSVADNGPKICLTCLERLRTCHNVNKCVPVFKKDPQKPSYTCTTCCQLGPANNMLNLRLTVVNADGQQINLEECVKFCWKIDQLTGENLTICLSCVSAIVEEYSRLPEFMDVNHVDVKIEPNVQESPSFPELLIESHDIVVSNLGIKRSPDPLTRQREAHDLNFLKCSKSPLEFESAELTLQHERDVHLVEKRYECGICGKKYAAKRYLASHIIKHRSDREPTKRTKTPKPMVARKKSFDGRVLQSEQTISTFEDQSQLSSEYKCVYARCTKVCRTNRTLNLHVQQKHEGLSFGIICRLCDVKFSCRVEFKDHLTVHTTPSGQLRCDNCTEVFANYAETRKHLHAEHVPFECHHCKYTSPNLVFLRRHLLNYHFRKEFKCRICNEVMGKFLDYKHHMADHKKASQNLQCDICLKKFLVKKSFDYHCSRWKNVFSFSCTKCDVRCHTPGQLETHMELKHNEFFPCHICNQPFRNTFTMRQHLKRIHGVIPKSKCRKCGLIFGSPVELTAHMKNEHQKITKTKYVCEQCGQGFDNKCSLAKHVQRHKTRQFACKECDRVYKKPQSLNNHVQIIHLRIKNRRSTNMVYTCPKCPQWKFGRHQALEGHMIVHNTENRAFFQCNNCGIAYTRRQKFDVHIKKCQKT